MLEEHKKALEDRLSARRHETRIFPITNSYGVYDYFKYYRKNRPKERSYYKMTSDQYYKLLRKANECLMDALMEKAQVVLPNKFGELVIIKKEATVKIDENGKMKTNRPINWDATIKLWFEDPEAEKAKTLVRWDNAEVISVKYRKTTARYENSPFYNLQVTRAVKKKLADHIKNKGFDTPFFIDENHTNIKALYNGRPY